MCMMHTDVRNILLNILSSSFYFFDISEGIVLIKIFWEVLEAKYSRLYVISVVEIFRYES